MSQNIIIRNRGDSNSIKINIRSGLSELNRLGVTFVDSEFNIYFGVMLPHQKFEDAIIRKRFTINDCDCCGNLIIQLSPADTLDLKPGIYYYSIKMSANKLKTEKDVSNTEMVITLINKTKLILND